MLAGFEKSSEGQIFFQGTDVTDLPPNERKINTVFQKYALFPHLNIYDNISFGLKEKKVPKDEIEARTLNQIENGTKPVVCTVSIKGRNEPQCDHGIFW